MHGKQGKGVGLLAILGGGPGEGSGSSKDMACKAMWKAIKRDDYEGFKSAMDEYLTYREEESGAEEMPEDESSEDME
jgi:hypothetical protein